MTQIFFTPDGYRLRAGWRLAIQTTILFSFGLCISIPIFGVLLVLDPSILTTLQLKPEHLLAATVGETIAVTTSVFLARKFIDKQPIESLGLKLNIQAFVDVMA